MKTPHAIDPGKILRQRYLDIGIAFVIAHQDIVLGAILFNIIALQYQRFDFIFDDKKLYILDTGHHTSIFRAEIGRLLEIGAHAIEKWDGFANVDNGALGVFHQVDARFMW